MPEERRGSRTAFGELIQPSSWASLPPPERLWSADDWERICRGRVPEVMEDKWNAFVENNTLFLHRSWTGLAVYAAHFEPVASGWRIREARVADDPVAYHRGSDEYEKLLLEALIEGVLLKRWSDYPERLTGLRDSSSVWCPSCGVKMVQGWMAMWNPILGQKVRWQPTRPGYGRLRVPPGAAVVLKARVGGRDARIAHRCPSCLTIVVLPDAAYDPDAAPKPRTPAGVPLPPPRTVGPSR